MKKLVIMMGIIGLFVIPMVSCYKNESSGKRASPAEASNIRKGNSTLAKSGTLSIHKRVNIELRKKPLKKLLEALRRQTNLEVYLAEDNSQQADAPISIKLRNIDFWEAIVRILTKTGLGIEVEGDKILLTKPAPSLVGYYPVEYGLFLLDAPIAIIDNQSKKEIRGLSIRFLRDPDEIVFIGLNTVTAISKGGRKPVQIPLERIDSSPWEIEWVGSLPKEVAISPEVTIEGEIQADCRYEATQFLLMPKVGAKVTRDNFSAEVASFRKQGQLAKAQIIIRQKKRLSTPSGGPLSVLRIVPQDATGKELMPFGYRGGGYHEKQIFDATMPSSVSMGGRIVVTLVGSKKQKLSFHFTDIRLK